MTEDLESRVKRLEKEMELVLWKVSGMEKACQVCRKQVCSASPLTGKALELKKEVEARRG